MISKIKTNNTTQPILTAMVAIDEVHRGGMDLQPTYQRGYIWSNEFKDKLLYSIICQYPIGNIIVRDLEQPNDKGAAIEVVDGQQRLTTIHNFINGDYEIQSDVSRDIIDNIIDYFDGDEVGEPDKKLTKLKKKLTNKGKINLRFSDLPKDIQNRVQAYPLAVAHLINATDDEVTRYFRYLQNQERLRAGEIIKSMPDTKLEKYLKMFCNIDSLLGKLHFSNERRQFDKAFYSIVGLLDDKISLGITDKEVMRYVENCGDLSHRAETQVMNMVNAFNFIAEDKKIPSQYVSYNIRAMKFMMLLAAFGMVDFTSDTKRKLKNLEIINDRVSTFNSAKPEMIEMKFPGYNKAVYEEYRYLTLIAKGAHPLSRVKNRIEILTYYLDNIDEKLNPSGIVLN